MAKVDTEQSKKKKEQLQQYVEAMLSRGFSESSIMKGLQKKGWQASTIKKVLKLAKLSSKEKKVKSNHKKVVEKKEDKSAPKEEKLEPTGYPKKTGILVFFFIMFIISVGICVYSYVMHMWIALAFGGVLSVASIIGYKIKSRSFTSIKNQSTEDDVGQKYNEALKVERLKKHNLSEIMKKKREEERYLKKIEKIKRREEKLKRKQEKKSKPGKKLEEVKLKKITQKTERLKIIESRLKGELDKIEQRRELLEKGKTVTATGIGETDLDQVYNFIEKYGKIKLHEIISMFGVSKEVATKWMNILESYKMVDVYYPAMGSPELRTCKK